MAVCAECLEIYFVPSRAPRLCRDCEAKQIAEAAKQIDEKSTSIAVLGSWLFGDRKQRDEWKKGKVS